MASLAAVSTFFVIYCLLPAEKNTRLREQPTFDMRADSKLRIMEVILIIGVVLLVATLVLPLMKGPQTLSVNGPSIPYGDGNYSISGYRIPPVDQNAPINVTLEDVTPDPVFIAVFPGEGVTGGRPVYSTVTIFDSLTHSVKSTATQPYTVMISSFNGTTYHLTVKATWSPYFDAGNYFAEAVFVVIVGLAGFSYYRETRKREAMEEAALAEVRSRKTGSTGA